MDIDSNPYLTFKQGVRLSAAATRGDMGTVVTRGAADPRARYRTYPDPLFHQDYRNSVFEILPAGTFESCDQLERLRKLSPEDLSGSLLKVLEMRVESQKSLFERAIQNLSKQVVCFGTLVMLRHVDSGTYLSGTIEPSSGTSGAFTLMARTEMSTSLVFRLCPYSSYESDGNPIRLNSPLLLQSVFNGDYVTYEPHVGTLGGPQSLIGLKPLAQNKQYSVPLKRWSLRCPDFECVTHFRDLTTDEQSPMPWKFLLHTQQLQNDQLIQRDIVYLRHTAQDGVLSAVGNQVVLKRFKQLKATKSGETQQQFQLPCLDCLWQVERSNQAQDSFILRHLVSGQTLGEQHGIPVLKSISECDQQVSKIELSLAKGDQVINTGSYVFVKKGGNVLQIADYSIEGSQVYINCPNMQASQLQDNSMFPNVDLLQVTISKETSQRSSPNRVRAPFDLSKLHQLEQKLARTVTDKLYFNSQPSYEHCFRIYQIEESLKDELLYALSFQALIVELRQDLRWGSVYASIKLSHERFPILSDKLNNIRLFLSNKSDVTPDSSSNSMSRRQSICRDQGLCELLLQLLSLMRNLLEQGLFAAQLILQSKFGEISDILVDILYLVVKGNLDNKHYLVKFAAQIFELGMTVDNQTEDKGTEKEFERNASLEGSQSFAEVGGAINNGPASALSIGFQTNTVSPSHSLLLEFIENNQLLLEHLVTPQIVSFIVERMLSSLRSVQTVNHRLHRVDESWGGEKRNQMDRKRLTGILQNGSSSLIFYLRLFRRLCYINPVAQTFKLIKSKQIASQQPPFNSNTPLFNTPKALIYNMNLIQKELYMKIYYKWPQLLPQLFQIDGKIMVEMGRSINMPLPLGQSQLGDSQLGQNYNNTINITNNNNSNNINSNNMPTIYQNPPLIISQNVFTLHEMTTQPNKWQYLLTIMDLQTDLNSIGLKLLGVNSKKIGVNNNGNDGNSNNIIETNTPILQPQLQIRVLPKPHYSFDQIIRLLLAIYQQSLKEATSLALIVPLLRMLQNRVREGQRKGRREKLGRVLGKKNPSLAKQQQQQQQQQQQEQSNYSKPLMVLKQLKPLYIHNFQYNQLINGQIQSQSINLINNIRQHLLILFKLCLERMGNQIQSQQQMQLCQIVAITQNNSQFSPTLFIHHYTALLCNFLNHSTSNCSTKCILQLLLSIGLLIDLSGIRLGDIERDNILNVMVVERERGNRVLVGEAIRLLGIAGRVRGMGRNGNRGIKGNKNISQSYNSYKQPFNTQLIHFLWSSINTTDHWKYIVNTIYHYNYEGQQSKQQLFPIKIISNNNTNNNNIYSQYYQSLLLSSNKSLIYLQIKQLYITIKIVNQYIHGLERNQEKLENQQINGKKCRGKQVKIGRQGSENRQGSQGNQLNKDTQKIAAIKDPTPIIQPINTSQTFPNKYIPIHNILDFLNNYISHPSNHIELNPLISEAVRHIKLMIRMDCHSIVRAINQKDGCYVNLIRLFNGLVGRVVSAQQRSHMNSTILISLQQLTYILTTIQQANRGNGRQSDTSHTEQTVKSIIHIINKVGLSLMVKLKGSNGFIGKADKYQNQQNQQQSQYRFLCQLIKYLNSLISCQHNSLKRGILSWIINLRDLYLQSQDGRGHQKQQQSQHRQNPNHKWQPLKQPKPHSNHQQSQTINLVSQNTQVINLYTQTPSIPTVPTINLQLSKGIIPIIRVILRQLQRTSNRIIKSQIQNSKDGQTLLLISYKGLLQMLVDGCQTNKITISVLEGKIIKQYIQRNSRKIQLQDSKQIGQQQIDTNNLQSPQPLNQQYISLSPTAVSKLVQSVSFLVQSHAPYQYLSPTTYKQIIQFTISQMVTTKGIYQSTGSFFVGCLGGQFMNRNDGDRGIDMKLYDQLLEAAVIYLEGGEQGEQGETPKQSEVIIGVNNETVLQSQQNLLSSKQVNQQHIQLQSHKQRKQNKSYQQRKQQQQNKQSQKQQQQQQCNNAIKPQNNQPQQSYQTIFLQQLKKDVNNNVLYKIGTNIVSIGKHIRSVFIKGVQAKQLVGQLQGQTCNNKQQKHLSSTKLSIQQLRNCYCHSFRYIQLLCENNTVDAKHWIRSQLSGNGGGQQERDRQMAYMVHQNVDFITLAVNQLKEMLELWKYCNVGQEDQQQKAGNLIEFIEQNIGPICLSILQFILQVTQVPVKQNQLLLVCQSSFTPTIVHWVQHMIIGRPWMPCNMQIMTLFAKIINSNMQANQYSLFKQLDRQLTMRCIAVMLEQLWKKCVFSQIGRVGLTIEQYIRRSPQYLSGLLPNAILDMLAIIKIPLKIGKGMNGESMLAKLYQKLKLEAQQMNHMTTVNDLNSDSFTHQDGNSQSTNNINIDHHSSPCRGNLPVSFFSQLQSYLLSIEVNDHNGTFQCIYFQKLPIFQFLSENNKDHIMLEVNRDTQKDKLVGLLSYVGSLGIIMERNYRLGVVGGGRAVQNQKDSYNNGVSNSKGLTQSQQSNNNSHQSNSLVSPNQSQLSILQADLPNNSPSTTITQQLMNTHYRNASIMSVIICLLVLMSYDIIHDRKDDIYNYQYDIYPTIVTPTIFVMSLIQLVITFKYFGAWIRLKCWVGPWAGEADNGGKGGQGVQGVQKDQGAQGIQGESSVEKDTIAKDTGDKYIVFQVIQQLKEALFGTQKHPEIVDETVACTDPAIVILKQRELTLTQQQSNQPSLLGSGAFYRLLFFVLVSLAGTIVSPTYFFVHLIDIFCNFKMLADIFQAIALNMNRLMYVCLLGIVFALVFCSVAFDAYYKSGGQTDQTILFTNVLRLYVSGAIGDDSNNFIFSKVIYDLIYATFFGVLFENIVSGIMVDAFGQLRDSNRALTQDKLNKCFICGATRDEINQIGQKEGPNDSQLDPFQGHIRHKHYLWNYLFYVLALRRKPQTDYTGLEYVIRQKIDKSQDDEIDISWLPVKKETEEEVDNILETIQERLELITQ